MPQQKIKFSSDGGSTWTTIAQPDKLGYSFETTYTEDSGRVQSGKATVSPMFTVEAFSLGYEFLTLAEAYTIIQFILKGGKIKVQYPSVYYNGWRTGEFYVGRGSTNWGTILVGEEIVEDFQFNLVGVNPI